jgi:hypothetical protein
MKKNNFDTDSFAFGKAKKRSIEWQLADSDGDGVRNLADCNPYNSKEQGFMHTAGAWLARKAGKEETANKLEQTGKEQDYKRSEKEAYKENEQRGLEEYKKKKFKEAQAERQKQLLEMKKKKIDEKAEALANRPKVAAERRSKIKAGVKNTYAKVGEAMKQKPTSKAKPQSNRFSGMTDMLGGGSGGMNFGNPMSEFTNKKPKRNNNPMNEFGSGMNFGNPMSEFTGKRKKVSGMGFNPMSDFMGTNKNKKNKKQKAYNPFGNNPWM